MKYYLAAVFLPGARLLLANGGYCDIGHCASGVMTSEKTRKRAIIPQRERQC
jgi:hypothetical protein